MLKLLKFLSKASLSKQVKMPPVKSQDFLDLNVSELAQWLALTPQEKISQELSTIKTHPEFFESLQFIPEANSNQILRSLDEEDLVKVLNMADLDETTYFLEVLGEEFTEEIFPKLSRSKKLKQYLEYPKDSCGRVMQTEFFSLPIELTAQQALDYIRSKAKEETQMYYLYCLTPKNKLIGVVSLKELAKADKKTPLDQLVNRDVISVKPEAHIEEAIQIVQSENFVALPLVNEKSRLIGLVSVEDVVDEIQDQATADIYAQAGLQQMDSVTMKASLSYLNRIPWLILNLFLACCASFVIGVFEPTLAQYTVLAILMPIAAALGGNTAVQTLTVVTRGLATGDFNYISYSKAILKEVTVGVSLGFTTGLVSILIVYIWKQNFLVGAILGASMAINSLIAATLGATIPLLIKSLGKDPAVSSSVLVITLTDIFCFFSFLGLATLGLSKFSL